MVKQFILLFLSLVYFTAMDVVLQRYTKLKPVSKFFFKIGSGVIILLLLKYFCGI